MIEKFNASVRLLLLSSLFIMCDVLPVSYFIVFHVVFIFMLSLRSDYCT